MQLSVNGSDTFVATGGRDFDAALPTIVLLHGAGFDHSSWALHSRWFAHHGHNVLAPDLPGHGRSSGAPLPAISDMADWTAALVGGGAQRRAVSQPALPAARVARAIWRSHPESLVAVADYFGAAATRA